MTIEQLRSLHRAQPFRAFVIHLADGRGVKVMHREFLARGPCGRTVLVFQPDESFNLVDLQLVSDPGVQAGAFPATGG